MLGVQLQNQVQPIQGLTILEYILFHLPVFLFHLSFGLLQLLHFVDGLAALVLVELVVVLVMESGSLLGVLLLLLLSVAAEPLLMMVRGGGGEGGKNLQTTKLLQKRE